MQHVHGKIMQSLWLLDSNQVVRSLPQFCTFVRETHNICVWLLKLAQRVTHCLSQLIKTMHSFGVSMRWLGDVAKHCLGRTFGSGRTEKDNAAPTGPFSLHNESKQASAKRRRRRSSSIYVEGNRKRLSMQSHSNVRCCLI